MNEVKILHIADTHIGRKFKSLSPRKAASRGSEVLMTLEDTIKRFSDADIVLLAGDIFEEDAALSHVDFVCNLFSANSHRHFFISCGNHDCRESAVIKALCDRKPENVTVFSDTIEKVTIDDLKVCVYGVSFSAPGAYASLLTGFAAEESDYLQIMVMHGDLNAASAYNPVSTSDIGKSRLDYLALGHVHSFSGFNTCMGTSYAYPGVMEPGGFDETGDCGVIYGTVYKGRTELEFYPVSTRQYHHITMDITKASSNEEVISKLSEVIVSSHLYKISLTGSPLQFVPDTTLCEDALDAYYVEVINDCQSSCDILNYCAEASLRGKTANALLELKASCSEEVFNKSKEILTNLMCKD